MVYFVRSEHSNQKYTNWLCGGAIVSPTHILTAASCLIDVTKLYVIAAYMKYVKTENLDFDECTKRWKQRVVKTCTPKAYNFTYGPTWNRLDIGFAIVEKPYNFTDLTYRIHCSYVPRPIDISYDRKYIMFSNSMLIFGWGHSKGLRMQGDSADYNAPYLQVASTKMLTKGECRNLVRNIILESAISTSMICTDGMGLLDSEGNLLTNEPLSNGDGCNTRASRSMDKDEKVKCHGNYDYVYDDASNSSEKYEFINITENINQSNHSYRRKVIPATPTICVNDHGGPLVTWVGSKEVVVGVAVTSMFDNYNYCVGPSMFTSTYCTSRFILCSLQDGSERVRRRICQNMMEEEGYDLYETEVDWSSTKQNNPTDNAEMPK